MLNQQTTKVSKGACLARPLKLVVSINTVLTKVVLTKVVLTKVVLTKEELQCGSANLRSK